MKKFFTFCVLCFTIGNIDGVPLSDFYPFGIETSDRKAPTNDDGSTAPIPVSSLFPLFNHQHDSLIVNTNGVISFLGPMTAFTPSKFPLDSRRRLVAPYWADIDTRNGGIVWYRESTNLTLLTKASDEIQVIFAEHYNFRAAWMFIATWDNVAFYGADSVGKQKRCTFQSVLVTNGRHSFTIFLYNKIEWTTGRASGGNPSTGLGGTPAQVGFDAGDGFNFYAIEASRTASVINVTSMSNIDHPGKFIFRVDTTQITNGGCNVEGTLTITPREATMFGGTQLIISGPCFNKTLPYYWSDMFTVYVGIEESQALCYKMLDDDNQLPAITTDDVQPCPCTLEVASLDTTRFSIDPLCHNQEGSRYECSNQQFAQGCFKQNIASSQGYDHQCCYNDEGVLMNPDGYYGSGYVNRYHYHGDGNKNVPFLSNFVYDTLLYQHCCIYTSQDLMEVNSNFGSCASFYTIRPPNSCLNYIPPRPARVTGDPHFVTFDGQAYTFNPVGEFTALSNGNLSLQLRMEQIGTFPASSVTSFVVRPYPEAEIIEVQVNQIRGIDVLVNGTLLDFDLAISKVISVEGATIEKISENPPTVVTNFYTEGLSIQSSSNLNVLNLLILTSPDRQTVIKI
ncbi:protein mesh-like [Mytilus galloprovincialis]|uniref:protein mesh-like n=1 Tax=Mytilus galloprovincialis TaxID=29158 RepID=UPI003F7C0284